MPETTPDAPAPGSGAESLPVRWLGGRLRVAVLFAVAALLVVGVFALVGKVAGYTRTLDSLERANPVWLAVCFASQVLSYAAYVAVFRGIARFDGGPSLPRWLSVRVVFAALGATRVLAAAGAGGLAVLYWALRQAGLAAREATARVLAFNVLLYACFGAATLAAALALLVGLGGEAPLAMTLPWIAGLAACVVAAVWLTAPRRRARLVSAAGGGRVRRAFAGAVAGTLIVRRLVEEPRAGRATLLGGPVYWLGDIACLWAGLRAFGVELSVSALVLAYATGFLANMLPLPTGGVGGVDAATTFALTALGVPLASALLGVFTYRFFSFLAPTIPAVVALPALPRVGRELARYAPIGPEPSEPSG